MGRKHLDTTGKFYVILNIVLITWLCIVLQVS